MAGNNGINISKKKVGLVMVLALTMSLLLLLALPSTTVFSDDVEAGINGWTPSGLWHITTSNFNSSNHSWWYGQESTGNYDTGNVRNYGYLTSPLIRLPAESNLSFMSWYQTETGISYDRKFVRISTDNGTTWVNLKQISDAQSTWNSQIINLSGYAFKTVRIRFYFDTVDGNYNNYKGWYIDDVKIDSSKPLEPLKVSIPGGSVVTGIAFPITVHVTNIAGAPVGGASVRVSATGGILSSASGTTDAKGDFKLSYTAPNVTVTSVHTISATASMPGYTDGSGTSTITINQPIRVRSGDGLELVLSPDGDVKGIFIHGTSLPMLAARGGFSYREVLTDPPNLVANSGFESSVSAPANWSLVTLNGNTPKLDTVSHSGARSIKISIPGTTDSNSGYPRSDFVKAEPLHRYTLSAWVKTLNAGCTNAPAVRIAELDASYKWLRETSLVFSKGTNDWTQNQISFKTTSGTSWVYVYASISIGCGTFWVDDVALTGGTGIIANPGFENSISSPMNWSFVTTNGNTPAWDNISHSGARSIKISISGTKDNQSGYPKSDLIKAEPLQHYTFSAWMKSQNANGTNAPAVRVVELDANKQELRQTSLVFSKGTNNWTQGQLTYKTGINTSWVYVYANIWNGYGNFWVDDIKLEPFFGPTIYLNGTLTSNPDGTVTQRAQANDINFTFYYILNRSIELQGEIQDQRGVDRALQVMYNMPVNLTGWYWNYDGDIGRRIQDNSNYEIINISEPFFSKYPFALIDNGLDNGISIAHNALSNGYHAYNTKIGYYQQVFIGTPFGTKLNANETNFSMVLYRNNGGFRCSETKYAEIYTSFDKPRINATCGNKIIHATKEDFEAGTKIGVDVLDEGVITLKRKNATEYESTSGEYISTPIDIGEIATPYKLEWTSSVKPEENVMFQIRSANSLKELENAIWYGPTSAEDYYAYISEGENLILNPSLEQDSNNDGIPDYSRKLGYGVNDRNFSIVSEAFEGSKAIKVEITNYTSGDGRWEILYNGTIESDTDYVFGVWHKESGDIGNIYMGVGLEKSDGSVVWGYSNIYVRSSLDWKHDKFVFHTPNEKVTKIWVKLALMEKGWIISDTYSLKKIEHINEWKINSVHNSSEWMQYKINLSTATSTYSPSIHDITISYGASIPEIHWIDVLDNDEKQKYAFKPGETANFKVEILDFKGIANIESVNISVFDPTGKIILENTMSSEDSANEFKRYFEYKYSFPIDATLGIWKVKITAINKEGQIFNEISILKVREPYTFPPQKMTLGALAADYGFNNYKNYSNTIEAYSKYDGLEIWKLGISWDILEPEHGSFNEEYIDAILKFMDAAQSKGAKVQIGISRSWWPIWVNNGKWDNNERYGYETTERLTESWMRLAKRIKDHPAFDSYLIINEEDYVYDADAYLQSLSKIISSIRSIDSNLDHRITIRPNTVDSYIRIRIAQNGTQDYDYGTGTYPTSASYLLTSYENPISNSSYLRMSKLRSTPFSYGGAGGVGEIGFFQTSNDSFGDDEKLLGFQRAMSIAYDQGMDEFMLWGDSFSFKNPEIYLPKLKEFRDNLTVQPRSNFFNVRVLIDNDDGLFIEPNDHSSKLDMDIQPYIYLIKTLDEKGYTWFYTHSNAVVFQRISFNSTIKLSEIKGKNEPEQNKIISERIGNIKPSGRSYLWPKN